VAHTIDIDVCFGQKLLIFSRNHQDWYTQWVSQEIYMT